MRSLKREIGETVLAEILTKDALAERVMRLAVLDCGEKALVEVFHSLSLQPRRDRTTEQ
jgi:hypothetical protein